MQDFEMVATESRVQVLHQFQNLPAFLCGKSVLAITATAVAHLVAFLKQLPEARASFFVQVKSGRRRFCIDLVGVKIARERCFQLHRARGIRGVLLRTDVIAPQASLQLGGFVLQARDPLRYAIVEA
jgi:hypothetical protein